VEMNHKDVDDEKVIMMKYIFNAFFINYLENTFFATWKDVEAIQEDN